MKTKSKQKKKRILVVIKSGFVDINNIPRNVIVEVRDYDIQEETKYKDKDGRFYAKYIY